ncbi:MAG: hypothetical protein CVV54_04295 [Synergistetes bacterium HGW-Synergistetes-1]|nr:MAG: hypothetical protein CVV54_04295 [Synergistetes bacterium HGW-Synergistetes-1]
MTERNYLYRGRQIFVGPFGKTGFRTFFRGACNDKHPINISELPIRGTKEEARKDLEIFASKRMLKAV